MVQQGDQTAINSSIALLQERFRQLERMKVIRQEQEVMRMLLQSAQSTSNDDHQASKLLFHSEMYLRRPKPPTQLSLSLWPETQTKQQQPGFRDAEMTPRLSKAWLTDDHNGSFVQKAKIKIDDSICDVDTSLHL